MKDEERRADLETEERHNRSIAYYCREYVRQQLVERVTVWIVECITNAGFFRNVPHRGANT